MTLVRVARSLSLSLALSWALGAGSAHAFCRTTTARVRSASPSECVRVGAPLSWRNHCTGYSLYRSGMPEGITFETLDMVARASTEAWAHVPCDQDGRGMQYYRVLPNAPTWNPPGYNPQGENSNTVMFNHLWIRDATHREGTIAITVATFDSLTGEIFDADIELNTFDAARNPTGFNFSTTRTADSMSADLQTILTHEFGHFLGLAHSESERAVMWFEAGLGEARRDLTSDDAAGMCTIYPEANTPPTRCIGVPYGGLTTQPGGAKVVGACAVTARSSAHHGSGGWTFALGLAALWGRRVTRRSSPARVGRVNCH